MHTFQRINTYEFTFGMQILSLAFMFDILKTKLKATYATPGI